MARNLRLRSFAKINLGLEVLGVREDGYHEWRTLFQTIDLADESVSLAGPAGSQGRVTTRTCNRGLSMSRCG